MRSKYEEKKNIYSADRQLCYDIVLNKRFMISNNGSTITTSEVDKLGGKVNSSCLPNITGTVNFKERVALCKSMKLSPTIVPNLKISKIQNNLK